VLVAEEWVRWSWIADHSDRIWAATRQHVELTVIAVAIGLAISLPLGIAASRWRPMLPPTLWVTGVLYTIPSLALFVLLIPWTGLSRTTAEIGLVSYTLLILVRNVVAGLDAVPTEIKESATAMGYRPLGRLLRVELPLAVPAVVAGVRIATVTTIGLVTITALIGQGGLGQLILDGLQRSFRTPMVVGAGLSVGLAVVADVVLLSVQRLATPWARAAR
jgi:osmoprotectant transport system permease protein